VPRLGISQRKEHQKRGRVRSQPLPWSGHGVVGPHGLTVVGSYFSHACSVFSAALRFLCYQLQFRPSKSLVLLLPCRTIFTLNPSKSSIRIISLSLERLEEEVKAWRRIERLTSGTNISSLFLHFCLQFFLFSLDFWECLFHYFKHVWVDFLILGLQSQHYVLIG